MKSKTKGHLRKNSTIYEAVMTSEQKDSKKISTFIGTETTGKKEKKPVNHRTFSEIPASFAINPLKSKKRGKERKNSTKISRAKILNKIGKIHLSTEVESLKSPKEKVSF